MTKLLAASIAAFFAFAVTAEAAGRIGSKRYGGYTSSGKGSHYYGGYNTYRR